MKLTNKDVQHLGPNLLITAVLQQYDSSFSQIHANMFGVVNYTKGGHAHSRAFEILASRRAQLEHEVSLLTRAYRALRKEAGEE